jgi:DNA-binding NarL/FixJ family response regulator
MSPRIRLLLVDDQRLMRDGLRTLLDLEPDLEVAGEAENGEAGLAAYERLAPDVVLMDIRMPVLDGVEAIRRLKAADPGVRVIILTTFDDDAYVFDGLRAGALGYLLKDVSGSELAEAIRTVAAGGALIDPSVTRKVVAEFSRLPRRDSQPRAALPERLSDRELDVLRLLSEGRTNRETAGSLHLPEGTAKNYVSNILAKIEARDRTQAALKAR